MGKIALLRRRPRQTVRQLTTELRSLQRRLPKLEADEFQLHTKIQEELAPNLRAARTSYSELAEKRGEVREALGLYQTLKDLEDRRTALELEEAEVFGGNMPDAGLPAASLDKFSTIVQRSFRLGTSRMPNGSISIRKPVTWSSAGRIEPRSVRVYRAITQSAFTIGLLQYCKQQATPHPGFALLDSPLLSYKEPEGDDDDLRHTDLKVRFYEYLNRSATINRSLSLKTPIRRTICGCAFAQKLPEIPRRAARAFFLMIYSEGSTSRDSSRS